MARREAVLPQRRIAAGSHGSNPIDVQREYSTVNDTARPPVHLGPPPKHHLALMIWVAVLPTLTVLQLLLSGPLGGAPIVLRTLVMVTIAVPIVVYGFLPALQRLRTYLLTSRTRP